MGDSIILIVSNSADWDYAGERFSHYLLEEIIISNDGIFDISGGWNISDISNSVDYIGQSLFNNQSGFTLINKNDTSNCNVKIKLRTAYDVSFGDMSICINSEPVTLEIIYNPGLSFSFTYSNDETIDENHLIQAISQTLGVETDNISIQVTDL